MNYSVLWTPDAEARLVDLWLEADSRGAITAATNRIDADLGARPFDIGESREHNRRIHLMPPLGVIYRIDSNQRIVHVLTVWRYDMKNRT
jgi:mRNA-degrading endonuclease RelE of RelBE toxin-antitoxin system